MYTHIISPSGVIFDGEVAKITIPSEKWQITVLPHHANMIISLIEWDIKYTPLPTWQESALEHFTEHEIRHTIPGGICQIKDNTVEVIVR